MELGFWIPIVSRILDSLGCIPDSKPQDFGFHNENFPGFGNPNSLTCGDIIVLILAGLIEYGQPLFIWLSRD